VSETDEALFRRVQDGDREAFADLVGRYHRRAYAVAFRLLGQREDAEDAVQHAFLRLYEARAAYNARWQLNTWFYRILTNACVDALRRRRPAVPLDDLELPAGETPERAFTRREQRRLLQTALAAVPLEARIVLTLYYGEERSYQEIGAIRGISTNTVKTQLRRGRLKLKRALSARGVIES
jgi:RNA polymerase sigma-70 factor, ECF subfamily